MGVVNSLADRLEESTGIDTTGPIEEAPTGYEAYGRLATGTYAFGESVVSDLTGSSEAEVRNDFVATGAARTAVDTAYDYEGTWGGQEDTADLVGPAAWGTEGSVTDAAVDRAGEEKSAEERKTKLLIYAAIAAVALYLLAPLLELGAAVAGD